MSKLIAVANQKGGVGKTTTSINLAASLVATRRSILLIDIDPQGNATTGSGIDKNQLTHSIADLLLNTHSFHNVCVGTPFAGYDLLPSGADLIAAEVDLLKQSHHERRLHDALEPIKTQYDFIIIDCPPALNVLTLNALVAADTVLIPMQCEYYALEGLSSLVRTIEQITQTVNPRLHIEGILRTMYDSRNRLSLEVSDQLLKYFKEQVYRTIIPRNVRLAEAPSHGIPALHYDKQSPGAIAYLTLAGELLRRQKHLPQEK